MAISIRSTPQDGDLVVKADMRDGAEVFVISTTPGPDQYLVHTRDQAIAQARAFARRLGVRVWVIDGSTFVAVDDLQTRS